MFSRTSTDVCKNCDLVIILMDVVKIIEIAIMLAFWCKPLFLTSKA